MIWSHVDDVAAQTYAEGITLRPLWQEPSGRNCLVVDLAPGAVWPKLDVHEPGPEEVYVVSGTFNDGVRDYPEGTFIPRPPPLPSSLPARATYRSRRPAAGCSCSIQKAR